MSRLRDFYWSWRWTILLGTDIPICAVWHWSEGRQLCKTPKCTSISLRINSSAYLWTKKQRELKVLVSNDVSKFKKWFQLTGIEIIVMKVEVQRWFVGIERRSLGPWSSSTGQVVYQELRSGQAGTDLPSTDVVILTVCFKVGPIWQSFIRI